MVGASFIGVGSGSAPPVGSGSASSVGSGAPPPVSSMRSTPEKRIVLPSPNVSEPTAPAVRRTWPSGIGEDLAAPQLQRPAVADRIQSEDVLAARQPWKTSLPSPRR